MRNDSYVQNLCENISHLWKRSAMPREEMARLLGVDEGMLAKIERGQLPAELTCDALIRFSRYFDIDLDKMFLPLED